MIGFVTVPGGEGGALPGPSVADTTKDEMVQFFADWEPEVQQIMKVCTPFHIHGPHVD